ncbi:MAG TPA: hypothetical protein VGR76_06900 [Candidatus Angelobacter sp.]|jgi:hypothetical protein|nr:hypothetical protein [Candidatus Angelobacter sp.]
MKEYKEAAAASFILAFVLLEFLLISRGSSDHVRQFIADQTALYWMLLELLQAAVWGACAFLLVAWTIRLRRKFAFRLTLSTVLRALLIPFMLLFVLHKHHWDLGEYSYLTIRTASIMGYLVAFAAIAALLMAEMALAALPNNSGGLSVEGYLQVRDYAQRFLQIAVVTLVAGTLVSIQTSAFLLAISRQNTAAQSLVKQFGTIASIALALFYAPTHAALWSYGAALKNQLLDGPVPSSAGPLLEWSERRGRIESALQLQITTWDTLGPGISVLAPVLTGLLLGK